MNDLRIYLLVIGLGVIAGIYLWGILGARKKQRKQTIQQQSASDDLGNMKIAAVAETDVDYSSVLAGLSQSLSDTKHHEAEQINTRPGMPFEDSEDGLNTGENSNSLETQGGPDETHEPVAGPAGDIVILHIIPRGNIRFSGHSILSSTSQVDLEFGSMNIFHHYGVGEMKSEKVLFSMANMMEPGSFDMNKIDDFQTPGLVLFMTLPGVIDGQIIFELMLNTAQRLSELLDADVCDENRSLINDKKIENVRSQVKS